MVYHKYSAATAAYSPTRWLELSAVVPVVLTNRGAGVSTSRKSRERNHARAATSVATVVVTAVVTAVATVAVTTATVSNH